MKAWVIKKKNVGFVRDDYSGFLRRDFKVGTYYFAKGDAKSMLPADDDSYEVVPVCMCEA